MDREELNDILENLTEEQAEEILAEEFDEEIEKQAAAEVAQMGLEDALYAYGAFSADAEVAAEDAGDDGLSKEASEQLAAAEQEISQAIEAGVEELGLADIEDDVELHKTAMAAAAIIFEGYTDQLEKVAAKKGMAVFKTIKKHLGKAKDKAAKMGGKVMAGAKKHKRPLLAAAGGAALGYGGAKVKEHMDKKASELTAAELVELTLEKQATVEVVTDGIEKLAARAGMMAKAKKAIKGAWASGKKQADKAMAAAKKGAKATGKALNKHKYTIGAGAGGVGAGLLAHRLSKKDK